jgi:hypothetical protein
MMNIKFTPPTVAEPGTLASMLKRVYAPLIESDPQTWGQEQAGWEEFDRQVFQHPETIGACTFLTWLSDQLMGFGSYDPRQGPRFGIIGHICILPEFRETRPWWSCSGRPPALITASTGLSPRTGSRCPPPGRPWWKTAGSSIDRSIRTGPKAAKSSTRTTRRDDASPGRPPALFPPPSGRFDSIARLGISFLPEGRRGRHEDLSFADR